MLSSIKILPRFILGNLNKSFIPSSLTTLSFRNIYEFS